MSDSTIYPNDTVDSVGENMSDSTIYPADTVDTVGENMSDCKIYPADTVDVYGNVWPTIGENIRNGSKEIPNLKDIVFPSEKINIDGGELLYIKFFNFTQKSHILSNIALCLTLI